MGRLSSFLNASAALLLLCSNAVLAQTPESISVEDILRKADEQRKVYLQEFRNLLSQETKTFEMYDKNGAVKKRRTVRSTFIVYQLSKGDNLMAEFRNVLEVDGKHIENADQRAQDFFEKIAKVESLGNELKKLHDESLRYDLDILVNGFTLFQSVALEERLHPYFEYKLEGMNNVDGVEVYVVSFQQVKQCPFISVNSKKETQDIKRSLTYDVDLKDNVDFRERLSGRFLIDAKTFQVWREERVMTLQPDGFASRVPLDENIFQFQKSEFGILTPKTITHTQYELKQKERTSLKEGRISIEYEKFTKPDVEVKSADIK